MLNLNIFLIKWSFFRRFFSENCVKLKTIKSTHPAEPDDSEGGTHHLPHHAWEGAAGGEVGVEVRGLPVRHLQHPMYTDSNR